MRQAILLLWAFWMVGCASTRHLPQVVERDSRDTVYLHRVERDSVFVHRDRTIDRSRDTVYVRERDVEYRYRLLRDTLRVHRVDSIPVIREVEVTREVARAPWHVKLLATVGLVALLLFLLRFKSFIH